MSPQSKLCPICSLDLPVVEFGVCRARKDGLNLYCKSCIRSKVTKSRRALKEYKTARKRYISQQVEISDLALSDSDQTAYSSKTASRLSPVERVRDALKKGARTQKDIAQLTKLGKDEIGDALANLLLWTREIRTRIVGNTRFYYLLEVSEVGTPEAASSLPDRKPEVPSSFSCIPGLMPGRNPEGEPEKITGWVAA